MSVPQIKDRPASTLRTMFAGIGSLLSVWDKVRSKPAAEAPVDAEAPAPEAAEAPAAAAPETTAPETVAEPAPVAETDTKAEPEATADADAVVAETTVAPEATAEAETTAEPGTVAAETAAEPAPAADALPLANYDELTVASLRARLRNLSNDDITQLIAYEEAHQNRPEVIKMFRNRLIKMTTGLPKLEA
jgi:hypothetical protein